jgi:pimeloyl-ACP methyl ester carboxylesterase
MEHSPDTHLLESPTSAIRFRLILMLTLFVLSSCGDPDGAVVSGESGRVGDTSDTAKAGDAADHAVVSDHVKARFTMLEPCSVPFVEEELLCGRLEVPENREDADSRMISLHITVVPSLSEHPEPDPLFDFSGGPGTASGGMAGAYTYFIKGYRETRDIILVDQRGTGGSHPLHCDLRTDLPNANGLLNDMYPPKQVQTCREELEQIADLTRYTTDHFVDDIDQVREWLGFDRINLAGLSYGTRAAMQYMRRYPENVRAAVLMGVVAPGRYVPTYHAPGGQRALELLFDDCLEDATCSGAFPDIHDDFTVLLERLETDPPSVSIELEGERYEVVIRRDQFAEFIRSRLGSSAGNRGLPHIIHQARHGNFTPFLESALPGELQMFEDPFLAEGLYLAVTCAEDLPFVDADAAARVNRDTWFGNYRVEQQMRACGMWPRASISADFHEPLRSDIPVLMISGRLDQVTPPDWAEQASVRLTNTRNIVLEHGAHVPAGLSRFECLDGIMSEFIQTADPGSPDDACIAEMLPPAFETGKIRH